MPPDHPSYPRSPIVEALLEIHFRFAPEKKWQASLPGALWKEVADDFPEIEPIVEAEFAGFSVDEHGIQPITEGRRRYRFVSRDRQRVLQLWENRIAISVLRPYPGWETFLDCVVRYWSVWLRVAELDGVTRVGLRYINLIEKSEPGERVRDWLEPSPYVARCVLDASMRFMSRVQVPICEHSRAIVGVADHPGPGGGTILLDIDIIVERAISPEPSAIRETSERLHEHAWEIFKSFRSARLEAWMLEERIS